MNASFMYHNLGIREQECTREEYQGGRTILHIRTKKKHICCPRCGSKPLGIYGKYSEKTFRKNFSKHFEWIDFNIELGKHLFQSPSRKAIAIDPSHISKSGKHTQRMKRSARAVGHEHR